MDNPSEAGLPEAVFHVHDVSKVYHMGEVEVHALRSVSLDLYEGEFVVLLGPPGPLGDGFRVEARIVIWEGGNVLKVPSSSLFRYGDEWSIFIIEDGKALRRDVEVGRRSAFEVEILRGIDEGAQVILHTTNEIEDGASVEGSK